ncbi:hypothetical protein B0T16DRAFT_450895 [Cercophora newfieldiana]|uniref:Uncharacterized protein n=1 Tax=Cercophora newfieldiana TaxID=92897 RepID=A0AA40CXM2_9PEZI|nr:hypothetical protein B0T16DRAFT_450895 [Cercophora newfieldiana]
MGAHHVQMTMKMEDEAAAIKRELKEVDERLSEEKTRHEEMADEEDKIISDAIARHNAPTRSPIIPQEPSAVPASASYQESNTAAVTHQPQPPASDITGDLERARSGEDLRYRQGGQDRSGTPVDGECQGFMNCPPHTAEGSRPTNRSTQSHITVPPVAPPIATSKPSPKLNTPPKLTLPLELNIPSELKISVELQGQIPLPLPIQVQTTGHDVLQRSGQPFILFLLRQTPIFGPPFVLYQLRRAAWAVENPGLGD